MEKFTERVALREYLEFLREERERITTEYWNTLNRLRELDEKEERETQGQKFNVPEKGSSFQDAVEAMNNLDEDDNVEQTRISQQDIEEMKDYDEVTVSVKRSRRNDIKSLSYQVASYLKNSPVPVKMSELKEFMEDQGHKTKNPTDLMNHIMEYHPRVERVSRGYYQYR